MNPILQPRLSGHFTLHIGKLDGSYRKVAEFDNLILTAGLERIGVGRIAQYCMVGSGSSAPAVGQTGLQTPVANTTSVVAGGSYGGSEIASNYAWWNTTYRFGVGQAAGNLSEVGVGWGANTCFSRALIVDGEGDPTTITVLPDEYLDVSYVLRFYWPTADATGTYNINSIPYDWTLRPANVGTWGTNGEVLSRFFNNGAPVAFSTTANATGYLTGATLGANTAAPSGSTTGVTAREASLAYVANSRLLTYRWSFDLSSVNPIQAIRFDSPLGAYQARFSPAIPKSGANLLTLSFAISWAARSL